MPWHIYPPPAVGHFICSELLDLTVTSVDLERLQFLALSCLLVPWLSIGFVGHMVRGNMVRDIIGSMLQMNGLNRLAGGLGDLVVNIGTLDLGHNMAVLNLNWDKFNFWALNAMLSGDLATSVLDLGGDRVRNSVGNRSSNSRRMRNNRSNNRSSNMSSTMAMSSSNRRNMRNWDGSNGLVSKGAASYDCWISLSFGFTLRNLVIAISRLITEGFNNIFANLLIFNLLSLYSFGIANFLC